VRNVFFYRSRTTKHFLRQSNLIFELFCQLIPWWATVQIDARSAHPAAAKGMEKSSRHALVDEISQSRLRETHELLPLSLTLISCEPRRRKLYLLFLMPCINYTPCLSALTFISVGGRQRFKLVKRRASERATFSLTNGNYWNVHWLQNSFCADSAGFFIAIYASCICPGGGGVVSSRRVDVKHIVDSLTCCEKTWCLLRDSREPPRHSLLRQLMPLRRKCWCCHKSSHPHTHTLCRLSK